MNTTFDSTASTGLEIAVIGMAGSFPGAETIAQFWENLKNGVESISFFTGRELQETALLNEDIDHPDFIRARSILTGIEYFDSDFFGYTPLEADLLEPQVRFFHQLTWHALEDAGYDSDKYGGLIGLYAGARSSFPWEAKSLFSGKSRMLGEFAAATLNDKDYMCSRISYRLNLRGPSFPVQTACSTSLVALHLACQGLLNAECDMALAGGISISLPQKRGYRHYEGLVYSPDGHCRPFDARANGTIFGSGAGVVLIKRLAEAMEDGDHIYAVIKGSAINNDGINRIGFTAPGIEGQTEVIKAALRMAEIDPETIGYIETHGTGTPLGDPIEIEALTRAFDTKKKQYCRIGAVKSNVGHLYSAAGVAGFIKTVLCLKHRLIPPSLHFEQPNPRIDFENTPFLVNSQLSSWDNTGHPLRAGISSFGIGGTNAHVILEEAPQRIEHRDTQARGEYRLIPLSAKTPAALEQMTRNLSAHLSAHPDLPLEDVAFTLQQGRRAFNHRCLVTASSGEEAARFLSDPAAGGIRTFNPREGEKSIAFMFPGQGAQYVDMGRELYDTQPVFKQELNRCFDILESLLDFDLKSILYPVPAAKPAALSIDQTAVTQPLIFSFEYALAQLLKSWGIHPDIMIGHSIGEYVAACLSGVFSLEDALKVVAKRGQLMQAMPAGAMLSVPLAVKELKPLLPPETSIAAVNGISLSVVSGTFEAIEDLEQRLQEKEYDYRRLHTSHAFHSHMMDPILEEFRDIVKQVAVAAPRIPYISNLSGEPVYAEQIAKPNYWSDHLRHTVQFADGLSHVLKQEGTILMEVGPGRGLSTLARKHPQMTSNPDLQAVQLVRHPNDNLPDSRFLLEKIGELWLYGTSIDWPRLRQEEKCLRLPLPVYPFEKKHYPVEEGLDYLNAAVGDGKGKEPLVKQTDPAQWFYLPQWTRSRFVAPNTAWAFQESLQWLLFEDDCGLGAGLKEMLEQEGQVVTVVRKGSDFRCSGEGEYTIDPAQQDHYERLFDELMSGGVRIHRLLHLWNVTGVEDEVSVTGQILETAFNSLLNIVRAVGKQELPHTVHLEVVSDNMQSVTGEESLQPGKALILGAAGTINKEYDHIRCRSIDVLLPMEDVKNSRLPEQVMGELDAGIPGTDNTEKDTDTIVALRGRHRWIQSYERLPLEKTEAIPVPLKEKGVYLITGGLGGIGLELAKYLVKTVNARLVLTGRSVLPGREDWDLWLDTHAPEDHTAAKIRQVRELEANGGEVMLGCADVTNPKQMRQVITAAKERFGTIHGVIHSAGLPDGGVIQLKTRQQAMSVLAPKVQGTLVLERVLKEVLKGTGPGFILLCSSVNSLLAPFGQAAYAAANAFLDAYACLAQRSGNTPVLAVDWDGWQQVGMTANRPKQEIISRLYHPDSHWFLAEHTVEGEGLFPGSGYLETLLTSFKSRNGYGSGSARIEDVSFLKPLKIYSSGKEVRISFEKKDNYYEFRVTSRKTQGEEVWEEHSSGKILTKITDKRGNGRETYDIDSISQTCNKREVSPQELDREFQRQYSKRSGAGSGLRYGPRWNNRKWVKFGSSEGIAMLELPGEFDSDLDTAVLHPALFDMATSIAAWKDRGRYIYFPFSYKVVTIYHRLPGKIFSYFRDAGENHAGADTLAYDISILDQAGTPLVEVEGFTLIRISQDGDNRAGKPAAAKETVSTGDMSPTTLTAAEGIEAFTRVLGLAGAVPRVVVSTVDLPQRISRSLLAGESYLNEKPGPLTKALHKRPRPAISTPFVPPRDGTELMLAEIWENFLGIDKVGIHDSFFELGATSLDINQVKRLLEKKSSIHLTSAAMFTYPTIRELKEYMEQGDQDKHFSDEELQRLEKKSSKQKSKLKQRKQRKQKEERNIQ
jgi:acyl transferase domain-containing protein